MRCAIVKNLYKFVNLIKKWANIGSGGNLNGSKIVGYCISERLYLVDCICNWDSLTG